MKIGIDCRMLGSEQGGLGRYVQQLVEHLGQIDTRNEYVLFLRQENFEHVSAKHGQVTKVLADIPWYSWREQIAFPALLKAHQLDVMHFPHWNIPVRYRGRFVVTIHDLIMYHYPRPEATTLGPLRYWLKDRAARYIIQKAATRATHILTTSEFTKRDITQTLAVPQSKMTVTYQAPTQLPEPLPRALTAGVAPYVLYVGSAYPHKNLNTLVKAWVEIVAKTKGKYKLVLIGNHSLFYKRLEQKIKTEQIPNIIHLDYQSDAALAAWYQSASAYVFPSLYEGFGLPPLEAMPYNVPIAASDTSCLPEVLGQAAAYFDPTAPDDLARTLLNVLTDKNLTAVLVAAGKKQVAQYSWEKLARQTLAVYEQN